MSNVIKIFENDEFGSLRTLTDEHGRIMFCGKDVASAWLQQYKRRNKTAL